MKDSVVFIIFDDMSEDLEKLVFDVTGTHTFDVSVVQRLWSDYGKILRIKPQGGHLSSIIVKQVLLTEKGNHPRGWNTDLSHQRKVKSYEVESNWYQTFAEKCISARIPKCLEVRKTEGNVYVVLEDLDASGFSERRSSLTKKELYACLSWLASFHATFLGKRPDGLWETGTYWHLNTRPDEFEAIENVEIKAISGTLDRMLSECEFQTIVHGDAKVANFCFSKEGAVASVDFQYVGGGCGMKDVVYFLGSCLNAEQCEAMEQELLDHYFNELQKALGDFTRFEELHEEWMQLYSVAWSDFTRFLLGWMPTHQKLNAYSKRLMNEVISLYSESKNN